MRVLLDEHVPIGLAGDLHGHIVETVAGRGWAGAKNGDLLRRMAGQHDVLITMDRSIEFQHRVSALPFGIVIVRAREVDPIGRTIEVGRLIGSRAAPFG